MCICRWYPRKCKNRMCGTKYSTCRLDFNWVVAANIIIARHSLGIPGMYVVKVRRKRVRLAGDTYRWRTLLKGLGGIWLSERKVWSLDRTRYINYQLSTMFDHRGRCPACHRPGVVQLNRGRCVLCFLSPGRPTTSPFRCTSHLSHESQMEGNHE